MSENLKECLGLIKCLKRRQQRPKIFKMRENRHNCLQIFPAPKKRQKYLKVCENFLNI